jgi:ProP effector
VTGPRAQADRRAAWNFTIEQLAAQFPACFSIFEQRRQPLKVGIFADVLKAIDSAMTAAEVSAALRRYCGNTGYLHNLREGAVRIDLDGNSVGNVTAAEADDAEIKLAKRLKKSTARKPASPPSKRIGLDELKAAARPRRAGS